jgi:hypothetical protein
MTRSGRLLLPCTFSAHLASFAVIVCLSFGFTSFAQEDAKPDVPAASGPSSADELALEQSRVADKYAKLEQLMLKMAELEGQSNPKRAQLLTRAVEQSKERLTKPQLETLVKLLNQKQLKRAIDGQATVQTDLKALLELLMSEDRSDRLKSEQQRLKEYIKEVERLIRLEKSLQGQTESNANLKRLADEQARIAAQTGDLSKKIRENEEPAESLEGADKKNESSDEKSGDQGKSEKSSDDKSDKSDKEDKAGNEKNNDDKKDGKSDEKSSNEKSDQSKSGDQQSGDQKSGQKGGDDKAGKQKSGKQKAGNDKSGKQKSGKQKSDGQKKSDDGKGEKSSQQGQKGENQPGENQQGQNQEGQEGQQQQGQQQQGQQGQQQQGQQNEQNENQQQQNNQQQNPARQRLDRAQQKMQEAQKKLEDAKRSESIEEQRAAREELEKAKADLEEILRQLREEEIARTLAQLEGRFRKMLQMQLAINESTRRLDQLPPERRGEPFLVQSGKLSADEKKIAVEAQKALTLLQEEGSSIAFPATVEQMHSDMEQVAQRLADAKIDDITIGVEEDIVTALEEMIAALQQAQRDQEEKQQQQQQQQQQGDDEQPLVDQIAELRMIKSLQERVNKRTQRYAKLLSDENDPIGRAEAPELADAVKKLGDRQLEIFRITRDIVLGKNQ